MKILVLNIDRDDDFGRKAGVKSPFIGLENNIDAAQKLGQIDPEDSDLNAIFSAIATYNALVKEGKDVSIATICGDINVGIKSDRILTEQLEKVIKETGAQEVIVVSDGAEDEYILPLIQSRIKITSMKRVSVKQSRELEDTYYRLVKLLDDDKVKKQLFLPIALILIVWAIFVLLNMVESGFGAILFTLGLYLLIRIFNWERSIAIMWDDIKSGRFIRRLSFYTFIIALVVIAVSIFYAYANTDFQAEPIWIIPVVSFLDAIIWGVVGAGLIITFGRVADIYVREKRIQWSYWIIPYSLFAFGFISSAIFDAVYHAIKYKFSIEAFSTPTFIGYTAVGIIIAFIGVVTDHYIKDTYVSETQELEIEKQTTTISPKP